MPTFGGTSVWVRGPVSLNSNDYESYHASNSGFAVVDKIEFRCGGLNNESVKSASPLVKENPYKFAEGVRTFVTFDFNDGKEIMEFPSFELTSGFEEDSNSVVASFRVEGIMENYPLLYEAIDNSRKVSGIAVSFNTDFEALVEFSNEVTGMALNLEEHNVGIVVFGDVAGIKEGDTVKRTKKIASVPVGENLVGRIVDALGNAIDDGVPIEASDYKQVEIKAPGIIERKNVHEI